MEIAGHSLPKWAPLAAGGIVLGFLLLRAKGAGGTSALTAAAKPAADPLAAEAQQLQLQNLAANNQRQQALAGLTDAFTGANQQLAQGKSLIANKQVGCPGGGLPRLVPNPGSWTGFSWECIAHQSGGSFLQTITGLANSALSIFGVVNGGFPAAGSRPVGTPGINGNARTTGDTSGNYPPGYVPSSVA